MLDITLLVLITGFSLLGWGANIFGLPGNWLVVAMALGGWYFVSADRALHVSLPLLCIMLFIAVLGELLEFAAGALGASRVGGSKRGTLLAIVGSMVGAVVGLFVGNVIPIPIVGPVIASLLLGASGAFGGAVLGERWLGKDWDSSIQVGNAAFWGRLLGTVGKVVCGTIVCAAFVLSIWTQVF